MPSFSCTVDQEIPSGLRLDRFVAENLKLLSRSQIKARKLNAAINGKKVKISKLLFGGEHLDIDWEEEESTFLLPEDLPLDVIYEDSRVIVVNKAQGMVVHPGAGNRQGTLANALLYMMLKRRGMEYAPSYIDTAYCGDSAKKREDANNASLLRGVRPGIVHRLDKDTSGVIIAAWDDDALSFLASQFKARKVKKSYAALVLGCPKDSSGCIEKHIVRSQRDRKIFTVSENKGRTGITYYKLVKTYGKYSLLLLRPKTGRTHQIRVHLKYLGNPILGDSLYGREDPRFKNATLMLHAKSLSLLLPSLDPLNADIDANYGTGRKKTFRTVLPDRFGKIIRSI